MCYVFAFKGLHKHHAYKNNDDDMDDDDDDNDAATTNADDDDWFMKVSVRSARLYGCLVCFQHALVVLFTPSIFCVCVCVCVCGRRMRY